MIKDSGASTMNNRETPSALISKFDSAALKSIITLVIM
jgi:hypothetical protein